MQVKTDTSWAPLTAAKNSLRPSKGSGGEESLYVNSSMSLKAGWEPRGLRGAEISANLFALDAGWRGSAVHICSRRSHLLGGRRGRPPSFQRSSDQTRCAARTPRNVTMATEPSARCTRATLAAAARGRRRGGSGGVGKSVHERLILSYRPDTTSSVVSFPSKLQFRLALQQATLALPQAMLVLQHATLLLQQATVALQQATLALQQTTLSLQQPTLALQQAWLALASDSVRFYTFYCYC